MAVATVYLAIFASRPHLFATASIGGTLPNRPSQTAVPRLTGSGLHEVELAVQSVTNLTRAEKRGLEKVAATILEQYGPLPLSKRKVVFTQTQRYLTLMAARISGGGRAGQQLLLRTFAFDFGNYTRLPPVTPAQRAAAKLIFQRLYAAVSSVVKRNFKDIPTAIRGRVVATVGDTLVRYYRHGVCDYYHPIFCYADAKPPLERQLYDALARQLPSVSIAYDRKRANSFIQLQSSIVAQDAIDEAPRYFNGWSRAAMFAYRNWPKSLAQQWKLFAIGQANKQARRFEEQTDPSVNGRLYPDVRQFLKGSGVRE